MFRSGVDLQLSKDQEVDLEGLWATLPESSVHLWYSVGTDDSLYLDNILFFTSDAIFDCNLHRELLPNVLDRQIYDVKVLQGSS